MQIAHMSRTSYIKKFKEICRMSPAAYITKIRIESAAVMLLNTSLSVSEIAYKTGFYDASHLTKSFEIHYSMTPMEYKNKRSWENYWCRVIITSLFEPKAWIGLGFPSRYPLMIDSMLVVLSSLVLSLLLSVVFSDSIGNFVSFNRQSVIGISVIATYTLGRLGFFTVLVTYPFSTKYSHFLRGEQGKNG